MLITFVMDHISTAAELKRKVSELIEQIETCYRLARVPIDNNTMRQLALAKRGVQVADYTLYGTH